MSIIQGNAITKTSAFFAGKDAAQLLDHFQKKKAENPKIFFAIRTDEEDHLTCAFWIDPEALELYEIYGDIVIFDATY